MSAAQVPLWNGRRLPGWSHALLSRDKLQPAAPEPKLWSYPVHDTSKSEIISSSLYRVSWIMLAKNHSMNYNTVNCAQTTSCATVSCMPEVYAQMTAVTLAMGSTDNGFVKKNDKAYFTSMVLWAYSLYEESSLWLINMFTTFSYSEIDKEAINREKLINSICSNRMSDHICPVP